jgi:menaquinone reductase, molybdopterin-binding-like subunit
MGKRITRRSLIKFVGGSAAGLALTPVPWKLLDDVSIWTQNWSWIPKAPRGPVQVRFTNCTLCPAGCALRARCVGDQLVRLSGVPGLPFGRGALCPVGLGAHHLAFHPARLRRPMGLNPDVNGDLRTPVSIEAAINSIAAAMTSGGDGSIAILDARPGRSISSLYRHFLAGVHRGLYITAGSGGFTSQLCRDEMLDRPCGPVGIDLENSRTILSIGAPLLNGWGSPDAILRRRSDVVLIQAETRHSETARVADVWLPLRPGTEVPFLLGVANVLVCNRLIDEAAVLRKGRDFGPAERQSYLDLVNRFTPAVVAEVTGLQEHQIVDTARMLATRAPAVVVGGADPAAGPLGSEEEVAIFGLNLLLGSVGGPGGLVFRRDVPGAGATGRLLEGRPLEDVPDGSVRVLILDSAQSGWTIPWPLIRRKIVRRDALVVSLSPILAGLARQADILIPAPVFSEMLEEVLPHEGAAVASYGLSSPMRKPPEGATEPATFIQKLAPVAGVPLNAEYAVDGITPLLKLRVKTIFGSGRGEVIAAGSREARPLASVGSPDELWKLLLAGGRWIDRATDSRPAPAFFLLGRSGSWHSALLSLERGRFQPKDPAGGTYPLALIPFGPHGLAASGQMSPLVTKLYQESDLMVPTGRCLVHPDTAREHRLTEGRDVLVETRWGTTSVKVRLDAMVMPGTLAVAVGPDPAGFGRKSALAGEDILSVCVPGQGRVWRVTAARVREV